MQATNASLKEELTKLKTDLELSKMLVDEKIKENRDQKAKLRGSHIHTYTYTHTHRACRIADIFSTLRCTFSTFV